MEIFSDSPRICVCLQYYWVSDIVALRFLPTFMFHLRYVSFSEKLGFPDFDLILIGFAASPRGGFCSLYKRNLSLSVIL